jgi:hypothetical protein
MSILEDGTFRPKQLYLDKKNEKLYWSDLEGMAPMHSNLDDSNIEVLIETPIALKRRNDLGISVDVQRGQIYLTRSISPGNAGKGRIFRGKIEAPKDQSAADCTDIKVLFDCLESIDLDLNSRTCIGQIIAILRMVT